VKIVLSRLDRLGDLILSTPTIRTLRRAFPDAEIHLVCSEYNVAAVQENCDLDAIYVATADESPWGIGGLLSDADIAIALAPQDKDLSLVGATRAPRRIGYTYVRRYLTRFRAKMILTDLLLSQADPALSERDPARPVMHEVEQLLELATAAGAKEHSLDLVLPLTKKDRRAVARLPERSITVHLAPRWLRAGSTEASFVELLRSLREFGRPILVTYAPETEAVAARIIEFADMVVGGLSFGAWAAALERAACVLTVDTGAVHVASALKRPTVVLFEHRHFHLNSREWAPWKVPSYLARKPPDDSLAVLAASRRELCTAVGRLLSA
jgi:ADP-heptose:LPS heptosyltransferase